MLYLLIVTTLFFVILNFIVFEKDYMHPSFLFCFVFFISELVCLVGQNRFNVSIHKETVLVFFIGFATFFVVSLLIRIWYDKKPVLKTDITPKPIRVSNYLVIALILLQMVTVYYFIVYLKNISYAYDGAARSLSEMINLYDVMTKFWTDTFNELAVPVPILYRLGNPLTKAAAYMIMYVMVNNFIAERKVNVWHIIVVMFECILIFLNGSRSPILRIMTMFVILFYVLGYKKRPKKNSDYKLVFRLAMCVPFVAVFFILALVVMGRSDTSGSVLNSLFIYLGAPVVNFDKFLAKGMFAPKGQLFGAQTFRALYSYAGKLLNVSYFSYDNINKFVFSDNGIEIGNVYTVFYYFVYDFGIKGVMPLIAIMALYYSWSYSAIISSTNHKMGMDFKLYIYAYLFNDLVMSIFSPRFYETALDAPFIKLLAVSIIYYIFIFKGIFRWDRTPFTVRAFRRNFAFSVVKNK